MAYRKFVASFAMLIRGTMADKLAFAMQLYDQDLKRTMSQEDMVVLLGALASCMDFFGDMKLPSRRITALVENIFEESDLNEENEIDYTEALVPLTTHPIIGDFMDKARTHASISVKKWVLRARLAVSHRDTAPPPEGLTRTTLSHLYVRSLFSLHFSYHVL